MSYELLNKTNPKARKAYRCIWCGEPIAVAESHIHEVSKYDGEFQDHRWHPECKSSAESFFRQEGETEFLPHEFARGTANQR